MQANISTADTHTPVGVEGCDKVPFKPPPRSRAKHRSPTRRRSDSTVVKVPQNASAIEINTSDIKDVTSRCPKGMTLNPSAAHGLAACTRGDRDRHATTSNVRRPRRSARSRSKRTSRRIARGHVYLGSPAAADHRAAFTIYLDAESATASRSGWRAVTPNPSTGRLEATFTNNPQLPFSELIADVQRRRARATRQPAGLRHRDDGNELRPVHRHAASRSARSPFTARRGRRLSSPLPFSLRQSTAEHPADGRRLHALTPSTSARPTASSTCRSSQTVLPAGLVGAIPSVPLCGEPQAQAAPARRRARSGRRPLAGAGPNRTRSQRPVSLTGPYDGAPYGLSIPVEAAAGPFDLGRVVDPRGDRRRPAHRARDRASHAADDRARACRCA